MRRALAAAVAVLCAVLLAGCGVLPLPTVTTTPDTDGVSAALRPYYGQRLVWKDCGGGFRCTTATAPEDWADPGGARISLALIQRPASGKRLGTLFTNPGGPGVSGVDFLRGAASTFYDKDLLDHYDLVAWDPRGVGASAPVDCYGTRQLDGFLFDDPDLPEGSSALRTDVEDGAKAFGRACLDRSGDRLAHVGTADTIQDLDMLRAAAGESKLDYFGFSYGTYIGALYADRFGPRVGRMVLDGAVDPSLSTFQESLANTKAFGAALRAYLRNCLSASSCPFRGDDVDGAIARIADLLLELRATPMRAKDGRAVNSAVLRTAIDASLYDEQSWPVLSEAIDALLRGRPDAVQALADAYVDRGRSGYTSNLFEAIYAVNCLDKPVTTDRATLEAQGEQLDAADPLRAADNTNDLGDAVCGNWPVKPEGAPKRVTAKGAPPIVVLGTTGDPATPYAWAQSLAGQLPGGVLLSLRGEGHTAYRNQVPCINDRVDRFFVDGTLPRAVTCG
ncbi:alpha/beta hydrolase [Amnibacterium kyonggiense]|uniref:Alpha/beta hydrolase family protein n=1 Tax=Amnibacterium kyonggiense TaxID=595671 RepID=A0A4R7FDL4_9MICO|nr:alpha/beta hydrolase [Amnibacterium kyonggiense]TDS75059.1 alpha/beta hydrolase family protein [Amnibacterium kyonggiense]